MTGLQRVVILALSTGLIAGGGPPRLNAEETVPCGTQCLWNYRACVLYGEYQETCEANLMVCMNRCNQAP